MIHSIQNRLRSLVGATLCFTASVALAQQSYTFTTAGLTGSLGPTQSDINTAYASTNLNGSVTVGPQGIQNFVIPITGNYKIEAYGAQGYGTFGGRGAMISGEFNLTAGTTLKILVGQTATLNNTAYSAQYGGGGGSFVIDVNNVPLVIAGGGGGSHATAFVSTADGTVSTSGNDGSNGTTNAAGGTNGNGGSSAGSYADGGGGLLTDGAGTYAGGLAFVNGGTGGGYRGIGGFGGGAGTGSYNDTRAGGGGGYSGGGGSHTPGTGSPVGGGGGSINNGANQVNMSGVNLGNGKVIITRLCDVDVTSSKNPMCEGETITLNTNAGSNVLWSTGETNNSISVSPSVTTSYTVEGVSSSPSACSSTLVITVTVNPLPNLAATAFPTVVCVGNAGTLTASGAVAYTWVPGNALTHSMAASPVSTTIYTVTGQNVFGCLNTHTIALNMNTNQLTVSPDTAVCAGTPAFLRASGALSYNWSVGAPFPNVSIIPNGNSTYTVTGVDAHGCELKEDVMVTVNPVPSINISAVTNSVCKDELIELSASGATSYEWSTGQTGSSINPVAEIDLPHVYHVTGTDANGCSSTASITIMVAACTSINEHSSSILNLSPNPASDRLYVETASGNNVITVIDVAGRTVLEQTNNNSQFSIDLNGLSAGVYYLQIQSGNSLTNKKFIKQ